MIPILPLSGGVTPDYDIVPLIRENPEWLTADVQEAATRAAADGKLYSPFTGESVEPKAVAPVDIPVGAPDYLFIRPGALASTEVGLCTYNFIYGAGTQIGLAGHCVGGVGESVWILAVASTMLPLITELGKVASFHNNGIGDDWALININSQWWPWVDPNMAYLGGPSCPTWDGAVPRDGKTVGHGIQTGLVAAVPRDHVILEADGVSFFGAGEISGGDSGSPIIQVRNNLLTCSMGAAAGILTHGATLTGLDSLPLFWGTDIRQVPAIVTTGFDPL